MKKILYPTDFSETSLNAFVYALHFAKKLNAEIITLHVYDIPLQLAVNYSEFLLTTYGISEWTDFENFKSQVPKLTEIAEKHQLQKVRICHMLERGDTVHEILKAAKKEKVDLIVMGTKGATGLRETFLGTIAEKIINQAHTLVLAIPEGCSYEPIQKVLFLTLLERLEKKPLQKVKELADLFKASIDVLQIKTHHDNEEEEVLLKKWQNHFKDPDIKFMILPSNAFEETVLDYIDLIKIDLVTMSVHHKNFLKRLFLFSLSRQMVYHSTIPLLSIPSK